jgi:hypothetical protein
MSACLFPCLSYLACKLRVFSPTPIVMRSVWLYYISPHYLISGPVFGKKLTECKMCFDFLYNICMKRFSFLRRTERGMMKIVYWCSCTVALFVSDFKQARIFLADLKKKCQISDFMTIHAVGAKLFQSGRQTRCC